MYLCSHIWSWVVLKSTIPVVDTGSGIIIVCEEDESVVGRSMVLVLVVEVSKSRKK